MALCEMRNARYVCLDVESRGPQCVLPSALSICILEKKKKKKRILWVCRECASSSFDCKYTYSICDLHKRFVGAKPPSTPSVLR